MERYVRPSLSVGPFFDAEGVVIDYGNRWPLSGPPEDTYSVDSHRERFAPLHAVADVLIRYLVRRYDVTVTEGPDAARDFVHPFPAEQILRAVRVAPRSRTLRR